uniref:Uncharacterized protein n=1 Tax=Glossina morsitans morsitans TaxID=37546 RepID=A0A1B0G0P7_GLOMM
MRMYYSENILGNGFLRFISFYMKDASKHTPVFLKLYDSNLKRLDDFTKNNECQKVQAHNAAITYYLNHFPKEDCLKFEKTSTIALNSSDLPPCTLSLFSKLINSAVYVNRWIIDQLQTVKGECIIQKM